MELSTVSKITIAFQTQLTRIGLKWINRDTGRRSDSKYNFQVDRFR